MTVSFVNDATSSATSAPIYTASRAVTVSTVNAKSALVLAVATDAAMATGLTVTDSKGQAWTKQADLGAPANGNKRLAVFTCPNVAAGSTTITVTAADGQVHSWAMAVQQIADVATSAPLDLVVTRLDTDYVTDHPIGPSAATAQADEILFVAYASNIDKDEGPPNIDAPGFTNVTTSVGGSGASTSVPGTIDRSYVSVMLASKTLTAVGAQSASIKTSKVQPSNAPSLAAYDKGSIALIALKGAAPTAVPGIPANISAYAGDKSVSLSWSDTATATSYRVYRSATVNGTYALIGSPTSASFTDTGLTNGTAYYYKIAAANSVGVGTQSAAAVATPAQGAAPVFNDWHQNGVKPSLSTTFMRTTWAQKMDVWFGYVLTTQGTGSNNRLPGPIYRIKAPDQGFYPNTNSRNGTVSEGIGYGMLNCAWRSNPALDPSIARATAKVELEGQYRYYDQHKNSRGLMDWHIYENNVAGDVNGATDGDFDVAEALRVGSVLHGDTGPINFGFEAERLMEAIITWEFVPETGYQYPNYMTNGDGWGFNTDSYMPDYFRAGFLRQWSKWLRARGRTDLADRLLRIIKVQYDHIEYYLNNWSAGVPDRQTRTYGTIDGPQNDRVTYNSVRLGFGIMVDYLWHGTEADPRAKAMTDKIANRAKAVFGTGSNVKAPPYEKSLNSYEGYSNTTGYGYVGSMSMGLQTNQQFATELFNALAASTEYASSYFNGGIGIYALAVMSGVAQPFGSSAATPSTPVQVTGLTAGTTTQTNVPLSWTAVSGATGYTLEQASSANGTFTPIYTGSLTSYTNTGLAAATTYYYRVKASNTIGSGPYSTTLTASTQAATVATPAQVLGVTAVAANAFQVSVAWSPATNASSYQIERATSATGPWLLVATAPAPTQNLSDGSVQPPNTTFYYRIRGANNGVFGPYSSTVSVTTPALPPSAVTGRYKVYNGTEFVARPIKTWTGTSWALRKAKRWNGSAWIDLSA